MTPNELNQIVQTYFGTKRGGLLTAAKSFDITYAHLYKMLHGKTPITESREIIIMETIAHMEPKKDNGQI